MWVGGGCAEGQVARRLSIGIGAILLLCAGAPAFAQERQLAYGLSPADVSIGFTMSVLEACVTGAERGVRLDQLGNYRILRDTIRSPSRPPKPGYAAWAPGLGQGIVEIEDGPGGCDVSAHGAPIDGTFDVIVSALRAKDYASQASQALPSSQLGHELVRTLNGRTIRVVLTGHEPEAASEFGTLAAHVTVASP